MFDVARFAVARGFVGWIPQSIHLHQPPTVGTVAVVVFFAGFAERRRTVTQGIIPPDALAALTADQGFLLQTRSAKELIFKCCHLGCKKYVPTNFADTMGGHQASILLFEQIVNRRAQRG